MPDNKATITDWRIVGVSGDTIDGRLINAQELEEMAAQYDPEIYGARINLEHINFLLPDYAGGYGDVIELKTAPWFKDQSKTALLAKLSVMPALQKLWDEGKKIYTSMEIVRPFADTGKAYLAGLAITDTPASLGTTANFSRAAEQCQSQFDLALIDISLFDFLCHIQSVGWRGYEDGGFKVLHEHQLALRISAGKGDNRHAQVLHAVVKAEASCKQTVSKGDLGHIVKRPSGGTDHSGHHFCPSIQILLGISHDFGFSRGP